MVARPAGGREVLVPVVAGVADLDRAFVLNELGAFLWHHLDGRADGQALVGLVCERFEVSRERAAEDCRRFLDGLLEIGAVEPSA